MDTVLDKEDKINQALGVHKSECDQKQEDLFKSMQSFKQNLLKDMHDFTTKTIQNLTKKIETLETSCVTLKSQTKNLNKRLVKIEEDRTLEKIDPFYRKKLEGVQQTVKKIADDLHQHICKMHDVTKALGSEIDMLKNANKTTDMEMEKLKNSNKTMTEAIETCISGAQAQALMKNLEAVQNGIGSVKENVADLMLNTTKMYKEMAEDKKKEVIEKILPVKQYLDSVVEEIAATKKN